MAGDQPDHTLLAGGDDYAEPTADDRVDESGSGYAMDRRSALKLAGATAVSSGLLSTGVAAATTRHDITFDTVLDAVDDLGMDPTGGEPIDLDAHIQSDTLIEFPAGEYLIGNWGYTGGVSNFGLRGLGSSHRDVKFLPPEGEGQAVLQGGGEGPFLVENLSLDERDDESSALWFGLAAARGGYMGDVEWLGRSPGDNAAGSDYHINADVGDTDATWVFENVRAGLDLPSTSETYPDGIAFLRTGPGHNGVAVMRDCVIHERNSTATRFEAGPGVVQMENCEFVNNQLCSIRVGGGDHPSENCVIRNCYVYGDGSRSTTAPIEIENDWPNPVTLDGVQADWDTTQGLRGLVDSPDYQPHTGPVDIRNCVVRNQSPDANIVRMPDGVGPVTIDNSSFTGDGAGISVGTSSDSLMSDSCFDMPNGSISGIETQNVSDSSCETPDGTSSSDSTNSGPSASITVTGTDGLTVDLSGADSSDADGQIASYDWDVDGTAYTGSTVTHTFDASGTYPVSLTVTDDDGATDSDSADVTVQESNDGPTASITVTGTDGLTVDLSGADSSDADGQIASYDWDVDGTAYTGSTVTHTFDASGTYPVSLTVTDDDGATDTASTDVSVSDQYENDLTIQGTGTTTNYEFSVSDSLAEVDSSLESWDVISGTTADGWVTDSEDLDAYQFNGYVTDFSFLEGDASVTLNGSEVDPNSLATHTLEIRGTGTTTNYEFSVSDSLTEVDNSLEPWDDLSGTTAEGWVTNSGDVDTYEFTGEVTDFTFLQGDAAVYLDGEQVSPSEL